MKEIRTFPVLCPVCGEELTVSELTCSSCGTTMRGIFRMNEFARLSEEQVRFLRVFLKSRGNLSEVQKVLGISYPTAKSRLDEIVKVLGYEEEDQSDLSEVLDKLERREITEEEALKLVKGILRRK